MLKKYSYFFLFVLFIWACDDDIAVTPRDDDPTDPPPTAEEKNYLPTAIPNQWIYGYSQTYAGSQSTGTDTTTMDGTIELGNPAKSFTKWYNLDHVFGIVSLMGVNKSSKYTNLLPIKFFGNSFVDELDFTKSIALIHDDSSVGNVLSNIELEQEFEAIPIPDSNQYQISGTITPVVYLNSKSTHVNHFDNVTLNGSSDYEDVYQSQVDLTMKVDLKANITYNGSPFEFTFNLVPEQSYGNWKLWFAHDIGLVRSTYEFELSEVQTSLSIPGIGDFNLSDLGISIDDILLQTKISGVAELAAYNLVD